MVYQERALRSWSERAAAAEPWLEEPDWYTMRRICSKLLRRIKHFCEAVKIAAT